MSNKEQRRAEKREKRLADRSRERLMQAAARAEAGKRPAQLDPAAAKAERARGYVPLLLRIGGVAAMTFLVVGMALLYPIIAVGRQSTPWGEWLSQAWKNGFLAQWEQWLLVEWQHGWLLWGLLLVPLILWWTTFGQDRRRPRLRLGTIVPLRSAPRGLRVRLRDLPGIVRAAAIAFCLVALARPIMVLSNDTATEEGIDIVVVMDLSGSMAGVMDADRKSVPRDFKLPKDRMATRLDIAKLVVQDFVSRRKTDRIGVIVFGKQAYVLSPPTLDYPLLSKLVGDLTLRVIDSSKTAIGDALATSVARLRHSDANSKVVILLTDGDNNAGKVSPDYAVELASKHGCKIYTIQIGDGAEVKVQSGTTVFGKPHYLTRRYPTNPELLQRIADKTGAKAFIATDARALRRSMHSILDQLEKTRFEAAISHHQELFALWLVPGVLLVGFEALLRALLLRRFP